MYNEPSPTSQLISVAISALEISSQDEILDRNTAVLRRILRQMACLQEEIDTRSICKKVNHTPLRFVT